MSALGKTGRAHTPCVCAVCVCCVHGCRHDKTKLPLQRAGAAVWVISASTAITSQTGPHSENGAVMCSCHLHCHPLWVMALSHVALGAVLTAAVPTQPQTATLQSANGLMQLDIVPCIQPCPRKVPHPFPGGPCFSQGGWAVPSGCSGWHVCPCPPADTPLPPHRTPSATTCRCMTDS